MTSNVEMLLRLPTAASIWTVAAVGLAVGGGLYLAASTSTVIILIILAGIKPLEEACRSRNQGCQLKVEVDNGGLTPEVLKETLGLRISRIKRFLVENRKPSGPDELSILLSKVSSQDIATYPEKLKELDGVRAVTVMRRTKDQADKSA
jgi:putative Mg2+ transporter-C (MgtC) family protein